MTGFPGANFLRNHRQRLCLDCCRTDHPFLRTQISSRVFFERNFIVWQPNKKKPCIPPCVRFFCVFLFHISFTSGVFRLTFALFLRVVLCWFGEHASAADWLRFLASRPFPSLFLFSCLFRSFFLQFPDVLFGRDEGSCAIFFDEVHVVHTALSLQIFSSKTTCVCEERFFLWARRASLFICVRVARNLFFFTSVEARVGCDIFLALLRIFFGA